MPVTHASTRPSNVGVGAREKNVFNEGAQPQLYLETEIREDYEGPFKLIDPVPVQVDVRDSTKSTTIFQENAHKMQRHATYLGKRSIDQSKRSSYVQNSTHMSYDKNLPSIHKETEIRN